MYFQLLDAVLELDPAQGRIVTIKNVSAAEEYLQDHFPSFPVLPGVLMIETLVQAARHLLRVMDPAHARHVLGGVRALKYGNFVRPGETLRVEVTLTKRAENGCFDFAGSGVILRPGGDPSTSAPAAFSGKFTLRPLREVRPA